MKIYTDFKLSKPTKKSWASVFGYRPEKQSMVNLLGEMFAVISISAEIEFDLSHIGDLLFDELQSNYFEGFKTSVSFADFEKALLKIKEKLEELLAREQELAEEGIDLELTVVVVREGVMYAAVVGESKVYISRGVNFAEIGKSFIDAENDGFMRTGSIELEPEDKILLATSHLAADIDSGYQPLLDSFSLKSLTSQTGAGLLVGYELAQEPIKVLEEPVVEPKQTMTTEIMKGEEPELPDVAPVAAAGAAEVVPMSVDEFSPADSRLSMDEESATEEEVYIDYGDEEQSKLGEKLTAVRTKLFNHATVWKGKLSEKAGQVREKVASRRQELGSANPERERLAAAGAFNDVPAAGSGASIPERVQDILRKALLMITNIAQNLRSLIAPAPGDRSVYLRGKGDQNRWKTMIIVAVVIVIVLFLVIRRHNEQVEQERFVQNVGTQITELENGWQQTKAEANAASIGDTPIESKQEISNKIDNVSTQATNLLAEGIELDRLNKLIEETQRTRDVLFNIRSFSEPQVVADLELTFEGAGAADITYAGGNIYVVDSARGALYRMNTAINSEVAVFATGLTSPYLITPDVNGNIVFADQAEDSVIGVIDATSGEVRRSPGLSKSRIGTLAAMDIYDANAALYSANATKTSIFRQENVSGSYQIINDATPWRNDPDFGNIADLAVDFSIFTLIKGKGLVRYEGGNPVAYNPANFSTSDLQALTTANALEISATRLYIADTSGRRIIVAERVAADSYKFKEQYVYRGSDTTVFTNIKDIAVNEQGGKIYVLDGNRVIRLDI